MACDPGTVFTGASLTPLTVIVNCCVTEVSWPPLAVPPLSWSVTDTVAEPLALGADVKVSVPAGLIAGCTEKRPLLLFVTVKANVWPLSLAGPALIFAAWFGMVCGPLSSLTTGPAARANVGASFTALTVSTKVSVMLTGAVKMVPATVTLIVVVPF